MNNTKALSTDMKAKETIKLENDKLIKTEKHREKTVKITYIIAM